ncbi:MAG: hypothetical protein KatS3mg115_1055 [Candidatus Poribacteria bacterium]|nr:MAG: hypothetical protein KatS3mg115_1055 [Candidatus Poribacteria bacterium]
MSGSEPLGLIAGTGRLPVHLAAAVSEERPLVVISVAPEPQPELSRYASHFQHLSPGRLRAIIRTLQRWGARELVFLGGVDKRVLFRPFALDWLALRALRRLRTRGDRAIFAVIAEVFAEHGFLVCDQRAFLQDLLVPEGALTPGRIRRRVREDAQEALRLAREIARLDIGQSVVVKDGVPLAVEAMDGTDATVRRGAALGGPGIVLGKAAHPEHDFRFDVPTVGPDTVRLLVEVKAAALALEAGRTFLLDRQEALRIAEAGGLAVLALRPEP